MIYKRVRIIPGARIGFGVLCLSAIDLNPGSTKMKNLVVLERSRT
jgi:hypothetical protein